MHTVSHSEFPVTHWNTVRAVSSVTEHPEQQQTDNHVSGGKIQVKVLKGKQMVEIVETISSRDKMPFWFSYFPLTLPCYHFKPKCL